MAIRPWGTLLSVWNTDASDKSKIREITKRLKELFRGHDIKYAAHKVQLKTNISNRKNSINKLAKKGPKSETESSEDEAGSSQRKSYLAALLASQVAQQAVAPQLEKVEQVVKSSSRNEEPQAPSLEVKESEAKEQPSPSQDSEEESASESENASNEAAPVVAEVAPAVEEQAKEVPQVEATEGKKKKKNQKKKKSAKSKVVAAPVSLPIEQKVSVPVVQPQVEEKPVSDVTIEQESASSWWKVGLAATAATVVSFASAIFMYTSA